METNIMADNPLKKYFRQPAIYIKLPTQGMWYLDNEISANEDGEVAVYGLTAMDDIMLNTPDAMLNGKALEGVIQHCVPDVHNVKSLLVPDLEALFLGIKTASTGGKYEIERICPNCQHDNNFEISCEAILNTMNYMEESDTVLLLDDELEVRVKPYSFEMRQMFLQKQFEEDRTLKAIDDANKDLDDFSKAEILAQSIEKLSLITFELVSRSIVSVKLLKQDIVVTDKADINEWLINISKQKADAVIKTVNNLNSIGPNKTVPALCEKCNHNWMEELTFDPISFFGKP
jgi:hypothetical protein